MLVLKGIDYYGVLGLTRDAEINDIKHAYRRLAVQYSSKWQEDPEVSKIFSLAGEAYEVLLDNHLRAVYDKYGEGGLKKGVLTPTGWHSPYIYHGDPIRTYREFFGTKNPYADLLAEMKASSDIVMGGDGKGPMKKQEIQIKPLPLTLEEVYTGTLKKMKITRRVLKEGERDVTELREKMLLIDIKRGTPPGTEILFEGVGDSGPLVLPGDIKYVTEDKPHRVYERDGGLNLKMSKEVNLTDALGGMIIPIYTLDGRTFKVRITEVIRPGYVKVIHGEGMPLVTDPTTTGDLSIYFNVTFPLYIPDVCKALISKCLNEADELSNKKQMETDKNALCKQSKTLFQLF